MVDPAHASTGKPWESVVANWFKQESVARRDAALTRLRLDRQCCGHQWKPELLALLRHRKGGDRGLPADVAPQI